MTRSRSLTSSLYRLARASATARAVTRGPGAVGKRMVRRRVYGKEFGLTRRIFKGFGL